ncbi:hypothetical protein FKM82_018800 [Ascaphus truei]
MKKIGAKVQCRALLGHERTTEKKQARCSEDARKCCLQSAVRKLGVGRAVHGRPSSLSSCCCFSVAWCFSVLSACRLDGAFPAHRQALLLLSVTRGIRADLVLPPHPRRKCVIKTESV